MLNTTPLNTSELNAPGLSSETVLLAGTGAVVAAGVPMPLVFQVGMAATGAAAVTPAATLTRGRTAQVSGAVAVTSFAEPAQDKALAAAGAVSATGVLGLALLQELAASAAVDVTAALYSSAELFASASVDVTSSAGASNIEALFATGAVTAVGAESGYIDRRMAASPSVTVAGIADPDAEVGGVLVVGLSGRPTVDVTPAVALDPTEAVSATGAASIASSAALTIRFQHPAAGAVVAAALADLFVFTGGLSGSIPVVVSGTATGLRTANMAAAATVAVASTPRLGSVRRLDAAPAVTVTAEGAPVKRTGLVALSPVAVTSSGPAVKLADKLYGTGAVAVTSVAAPIYYVRKNLSANAVVTAAGSASPVYFTRRNLAVAATITVDGALQPRSLLSLSSVGTVVISGTGPLRTNLLTIEPDYRTVTVDPQEFVLTVEPQEFTLIVTTDSVPMITFTKQPTEILPYDIDFEEWIAGIVGGDEVESATCTVVSATSGPTSALTIDSVQLITDTQRVKVWTSGGTNGVTYKLTLVMLTAAGRRKEVDFRIKIKET